MAKTLSEAARRALAETDWGKVDAMTDRAGTGRMARASCNWASGGNTPSCVFGTAMRCDR